MTSRAASEVIGVDTGGTFTDLVRIDARGQVHVHKLPSTPDDPSRAVLHGLAAFPSSAGRRVVHGSTVGLNALLAGRTARAALVTGTGFADVIEIARQDRPDLYALHPIKRAELIPRELRFEVPARIWPDPKRRGRFQVIARPSDADLSALRRKLARAKVESIAICLLHSYADPSHERRIARALAPLGLPITTSAGLVREYREYERFSTAAVNACLAPIVDRYLVGLAAALGDASLELLQSTGGRTSARVAAREPVRVLLSGPAGGVVGAARAASEAGWSRMVSLDMGGTSTDVAFESFDDGGGRGGRDETVLRERTAQIAGHALAVPAMDIHTIGCGGGSLVAVDAGGALHVGPQSAGADPGPVCYGRSDRLTVTDAHALLGHLGSGQFLGGGVPLDIDRVERAFERWSRRLGCTPRAAAVAVIDSAQAAMRRALQVMTMQRGIDPRAVPLVAFGGAGGLHAADLARAMGLPAALVPAHPGALSALGLARSRHSVERSRSVLAPLSAFGPNERARLWRELEREVAAELEGSRSRRSRRTLQLRYLGQSYDLSLTEGRDVAAKFVAAHRRLYGYVVEDREIEIVGLRLWSGEVDSRPSRVSRMRERKLGGDAIVGQRKVHFAGVGTSLTRCIDRSALVEGHAFVGPALVEEFSATTLVPPGVRARVTAGGHLELR